MDNRLDQIKRTRHRYETVARQAFFDVNWLVAEVERLQDEMSDLNNERRSDEVRALADEYSQPFVIPGDDFETTPLDPAVPVGRLRAVLGEGERLTEPPGAADVGSATPRDDDSALREALTQKLIENSITPGGEGDLHSWRCSYPDRYPGYCTCVPELVDDLMEGVTVHTAPAFDAARAESAGLRARLALAGCFRTMQSDGWGEGLEVLPSEHEYRIDELTDALAAAQGLVRALGELIRAEHVPEEVAASDLGDADTFLRCKGCGVDLDNDTCPYLDLLGRDR